MSKAFHALDRNASGEMAEVIAGVGTLTEARTGTNIYQPDWDNIWRVAKSQEPCYRGGRRVENLLTQSGDLSHADWTKTEVTAALVGVASGGYTQATKVLETATTAAHRVYQQFTSAGEQYTATFVVKNGLGRDWVYIKLTDSGSTARYVWFNITTGVIGTEQTNMTGHIETLTGGWYRISATVSASVTGTNYAVLYVGTADNSTASYLGDIAKGFYVTDAQLEDVSGQDDPAPSEYIATTTTQSAQVYANKRRTNLCLQSQALDTGASWQINNVVMTGETTTDPNGGSTADTLTVNGASGASLYSKTAFSTPSTLSTFSLYAKADSHNILKLIIYDGTTYRRVWFDLTAGAGAVGTVEAGVTSTGIVDAGDGWYRCYMTAPTVPAATNAVYLSTTTTDNTNATTNTHSIFVWGAQAEQGSTATAYIPTTDTVASSSFDTNLTEVPWLYGGPTATNLLTYSRDLTDASWVETGTSVAAYDAVGLTGAANTASTLTDDSASVTEWVRGSTSVPIDSLTNTARWFILKDDDETRFPECYLAYVGGTTQYNVVQINTKTGASNERAKVGTGSHEVNDAGLWWEVVVSLANNNTNSLAYTYTMPARGNTLGGNDVSAQGSIIVGNTELYLNKTIAQVRGSSPIFTAGATGTVNQCDLSFDIANQDDTEGAWYCEYKNVSVNGVAPTTQMGVVGTESGGRFIYTASIAGFSSYDGVSITSSASLPVSMAADDTEYKTATAYGDGNKRVNVDDAWGTAGTYDGTFGGTSIKLYRDQSFGSIAAGVGLFRNLRRYDMSYTEAVNAIPNMMNGTFPPEGAAAGLGLTFGKMGLR